MATISLYFEEADELHVVALGVGTKFMPRDVAKSDGHRRQRVRDSHAEVLARRALLRFFYREIGSMASAEKESAFLQRVQGPRFRMRPGITLHLYVSTAPCGWASATSSSPGHPLPQCFLAKGSSGGQSAPAGCVCLDSVTDAEGVVGVSLSCSDKIARWQAFGLEGALLSHVLEGPLRLASVTVGRKFDHARCQAALNSRADASSQGRPLQVFAASVSLEVAASALRGGSYAGAQLEKGDGDECLTWAAGDIAASRHDGRTGAAMPTAGDQQSSRTTGAAVPLVSGARLLADLNSVRAHLGEERFDSYAEAKRAATSWREQKKMDVQDTGPVRQASSGHVELERTVSCELSLSHLADIGLSLRSQGDFCWSMSRLHA